VSLSEGERSKWAKRCVIEVAMLTGMGIEQALTECIKLLQLVEGKLGPEPVQNQTLDYWTDRPYDRTQSTAQARPRAQKMDDSYAELQRLMQDYSQMSQQVSEMMSQMQTTLRRAMEVYERKMVYAS